MKPLTLSLICGTLALSSLPTHSYADTGMDALLAKLQQKGILTADEASELKAETLKETASQPASTASKFAPGPDYVTGYKFSGDFRGRVDDQSSSNRAYTDRLRMRNRLRVGLAISMKDNFEVGFRLGSGDGNALTNNQTLTGNGNKKGFWVDTAYGKWTAVNNGVWKVVGTIGKMSQPLDISAMLFDPDYTPEGAAVQTTMSFGDGQKLRFNGAAYALDEVGSTSRDPYLFGAQAFWDSRLSDNVSTTLGVSLYDITHTDMLNHSFNSNTGNTLVGGTYAYHYRPVVVDGAVTFLNGAAPVKLAAEYMHNGGADNGNNTGWWVGATLGKARGKGTWDVSYRYQRLEADAWWDQIVDDDNAAAFTSSLTSASLHGGTNVKGSLVKFSYMLTNELAFGVTAYKNTLIENAFPGNDKTDGFHSMVDLMWKY